MADIATASINSLNTAVNLLTRAASRLDEGMYSFKDFLKDYQAKSDEANKALFDQYKKLLAEKEKKESEKRKGAGVVSFENAEKPLKANVKSDVYTPLLTKMGLSLSTQNLKLDQIINIFREKSKTVKGIDKTPAILASLVEEVKKPQMDDFVSATELSESEKTTIDGFSDIALEQIKSLFTETQKVQVQGKAGDKAGESGILKKASTVLVIGAVAVALTGFILAVAKFADIPAGNIAKVAVIMGILGLAIYGITKIPSRDMIIVAAAMGILSLALIGVSFALEKLTSISWEGVGKGVLILGGLSIAMLALASEAPMVLIASAALGIFALAMIGIVSALTGLQSIQWETLGKFAVFLVGLTAGLLGLSALIPVLIPGVALFAAMGAALIVFGGGVAAVGAGLNLLAPSLPLLTSFFREITSVNPITLLALAPGIVAFSLSLGVLSTALLAFSASKLISGAISAIGSMFSKLVPDDEIAKIKVAISAIKELQTVQGIIDLGPLNASIVRFSDAISKVDNKKVSTFSISVVTLAAGASSASPALERFASISLDNINGGLNSLSVTVLKLNPGLLTLSTIDLRPITSQSKGLQGIVDAINDVDPNKLDALSTANFNNLSQGLTTIAGVSNLDLAQPISQIKSLVDTVDELSLIKITALASIIAAGKPLQLNIQAKAPQPPSEKDKLAIQNNTESLERSIGDFKDQSLEQLTAVISGLEVLAAILKAKDSAQNTAISAHTIINSGSGKSSSTPILTPSPLNTKALSQSPLSLNGRGGQ